MSSIVIDEAFVKDMNAIETKYKNFMGEDFDILKNKLQNESLDQSKLIFDAMTHIIQSIKMPLEFYKFDTCKYYCLKAFQLYEVLFITNHSKIDDALCSFGTVFESWLDCMMHVSTLEELVAPIVKLEAIFEKLHQKKPACYWTLSFYKGFTYNKVKQIDKAIHEWKKSYRISKKGLVEVSRTLDLSNEESLKKYEFAIFQFQLPIKSLSDHYIRSKLYDFAIDANKRYIKFIDGMIKNTNCFTKSKGFSMVDIGMSYFQLKDYQNAFKTYVEIVSFECIKIMERIEKAQKNIATDDGETNVCLDLRSDYDFFDIFKKVKKCQLQTNISPELEKRLKKSLKFLKKMVDPNSQWKIGGNFAKNDPKRLHCLLNIQVALNVLRYGSFVPSKTLLYLCKTKLGTLDKFDKEHLDSLVTFCHFIIDIFESEESKDLDFISEVYEELKDAYLYSEYYAEALDVLMECYNYTLNPSPAYLYEWNTNMAASYLNSHQYGVDVDVHLIDNLDLHKRLTSKDLKKLDYSIHLNNRMRHKNAYVTSDNFKLEKHNIGGLQLLPLKKYWYDIRKIKYDKVLSTKILINNTDEEIETVPLKVFNIIIMDDDSRVTRKELVSKLTKYDNNKMIRTLESINQDIFKSQWSLGKPSSMFENYVIELLYEVSQGVSEELKLGIQRFSNASYISRQLKSKIFQSYECNADFIEDKSLEELKEIVKNKKSSKSIN